MFEIGGYPNGIALAAGSLWVADFEAGSITEVDPEDGTAEASVRIGGGPFLIAALGDDLWTSRHLAGDVVRFATSSGTVEGKVPVGEFAEEVVLAHGSVWAAGDNARSIYRIDPASEQARRVVKVPGEIEDYAVDENGIWLTIYDRDELFPFTLGGKALEPISIEPGSTGVEAGDGRVWVANTASGTVTFVDAATREVAGTVETGGSPRNLAYLHERIWASDSLDGIVYEIDVDTNDVVAHEVPSPVVAFAATATALWGASADAGALFRIDV